MRSIEEIYNFIADNIQVIKTVYEDETGKHYGEIETLDEADMMTVFIAIENLLS